MALQYMPHYCITKIRIKKIDANLRFDNSDFDNFISFSAVPQVFQLFCTVFKLPFFEQLEWAFQDLARIEVEALILALLFTKEDL